MLRTVLERLIDNGPPKIGELLRFHRLDKLPIPIKESNTVIPNMKRRLSLVRYVQQRIVSRRVDPVWASRSWFSVVKSSCGGLTYMSAG